LRVRCRGNVFTESLPSNEHLLALRYSGFQASWHNIYNGIRLMIDYVCVFIHECGSLKVAGL
jgi:hypothetical protein